MLLVSFILSWENRNTVFEIQSDACFSSTLFISLAFCGLFRSFIRELLFVIILFTKHFDGFDAGCLFAFFPSKNLVVLLFFRRTLKVLSPLFSFYYYNFYEFDSECRTRHFLVCRVFVCRIRDCLFSISNSILCYSFRFFNTDLSIVVAGIRHYFYLFVELCTFCVCVVLLKNSSSFKSFCSVVCVFHR